MTRTRYLAFLLALLVAAIGAATAGAKPPPVPRYVDGEIVAPAPAAPSVDRTRVTGSGAIVVGGDGRKRVIGNGQIILSPDRRIAPRPSRRTPVSPVPAGDGIAWSNVGVGFAAGLCIAGLIAAAGVASGRGRRTPALS